MPERPLPTEQEVRALIRERRNWGRWGDDDQIGTLNFMDGVPTAETARLAYDNLDFLRGVEVFLN